MTQIYDISALIDCIINFVCYVICHSVSIVCQCFYRKKIHVESLQTVRNDSGYMRAVPMAISGVIISKIISYPLFRTFPFKNGCVESIPDTTVETSNTQGDFFIHILLDFTF